MIQSRVFLFGRLLKGFLPSLTGFYLVFGGIFTVLLWFDWVLSSLIIFLPKFYLVLEDST